MYNMVVAQFYGGVLLVKISVEFEVMSMARSYNAVRGPKPSKRGSIPGCSVWL